MLVMGTECEQEGRAMAEIKGPEAICSEEQNGGKDRTYLRRWRLLYKSLGRGRGLQDLLGDGRARVGEAPCGELLAGRSDDVAWWLSCLWHEGGWVDCTRGGFRSVSRGLPAHAQLAELCSQLFSLRRREINELGHE